MLSKTASILIWVTLSHGMPTGEVIFIDGERVIRIGDMLFSEDQFDSFYGDSSGRSGRVGENYRWPNGEIPYALKRGLTLRE